MEAMVRLVKALDGKLTSDERDNMVKVFETIHDEGMKACSEITRLKNKVNRLAASRVYREREDATS